MQDIRAGWLALRGQLSPWLFLGAIPGFIETGGVLLIAQNQYPAGAFLVQALGATVTVAVTIFSGGLYRVALHQLRSGEFNSRLLLLDRARTLKLGVLGFASFLSYKGVSAAFGALWPVHWALQYLIWYLLCVPFAFSVPLAADSDKNAPASVMEGLRLAAPRYFHILALQVILFVLATLIVLPFLCLIQLPFASARTLDSPWYRLTYVPVYALAIPWYTLSLGSLFLGVRPVETPFDQSSVA